MDVPRQRNHRAENATIQAGLPAQQQAGAVPEAWAEQPAKQRQKGVDARGTKKNAEVHYGYKNHVKGDAQNKLIERYAVTNASVHDSQMLAPLVEPTDGTVDVGSAYRSTEAEAMLAQKQPRKLSGERAYRNRPLSGEQKESNPRSPGFGRGSNTSSATCGSP